ncbi:MAG: hypothetical protein ABWX87_01395 [Pseudoxanthomonas sp.]|jgi:hypothetical protein
MSIFILQGPTPDHVPVPPSTQALPVDLVHCDSVAALVGGLRLARCHRATLVVVDAGTLPEHDCRLHASAMQQALDALDAPYIELHDRSAQEFVHWARPHHAALAVFNLDHDASGRYAMAMAVATRLASTPRAQAH